MGGGGCTEESDGRGCKEESDGKGEGTTPQKDKEFFFRLKKMCNLMFIVAVILTLGLV